MTKETVAIKDYRYVKIRYVPSATTSNGRKLGELSYIDEVLCGKTAYGNFISAKFESKNIKIHVYTNLAVWCREFTE